MLSFVLERHIPDGKGYDEPRLIIDDHDKPVVKGWAQEVFEEHPSVSVMILWILFAMREAVVPLRIEGHRVQYDFSDGVHI